MFKGRYRAVGPAESQRELPPPSQGIEIPAPPHPRVAAELAAMRELQGARAAMGHALRLQDHAERLMGEATVQLEFARREVRRIAEAKVAP